MALSPRYIVGKNSQMPTPGKPTTFPKQILGIWCSGRLSSLVLFIEPFWGPVLRPVRGTGSPRWTRVVRQ